MGQTNLALLVAFVSVSTTLLNVTLPLLRPASSDIVILFESMSDTNASFIARNAGRSGGIVHLDRFVVEVVPTEEIDNYDTTVSLEMLPNSNFVEPEKEQRISVDEDKSEAPAEDKICDGLKVYIEKVADAHPRFHGSAWLSAYLENIACSFVVRETSFHMVGDGERRLVVDCRNVKLVRSCIGAE